MSAYPQTIVIQQKTITKYLLYAACFLVVAHLAAMFIKYHTGHDNLYGLIPLFDLDGEANIPEFFSAALLLYVGVLFNIIARATRIADGPDVIYWRILSWGFVYLAFDEAASIHEKWIPITKQLLGEWVPRFAWVIPGGFLCLVFFATFFRFWLRLPRRTRWELFFAAVLLVGGGIGIELLGSRYASLYGADNLTYNLLVALEEGSEMAGSILAAHTLMGYLATFHNGLGIVFASTTEPSQGLADEAPARASHDSPFDRLLVTHGDRGHHTIHEAAASANASSLDY